MLLQHVLLRRMSAAYDNVIVVWCMTIKTFICTWPWPFLLTLPYFIWTARAAFPSVSTSSGLLILGCFFFLSQTEGMLHHNLTNFYKHTFLGTRTCGYLQIKTFKCIFLRFLSHEGFGYKTSVRNRTPYCISKEMRPEDKEIWARRTFTCYHSDQITLIHDTSFVNCTWLIVGQWQETHHIIHRVYGAVTFPCVSSTPHENMKWNYQNPEIM